MGYITCSFKVLIKNLNITIAQPAHLYDSKPQFLTADSSFGLKTLDFTGITHDDFFDGKNRFVLLAADLSVWQSRLK